MGFPCGQSAFRPTPWKLIPAGIPTRIVQHMDSFKIISRSFLVVQWVSDMGVFDVFGQLKVLFFPPLDTLCLRN